MIRELFEKGHIEYISGEEWKPFGSYLVSSFGRIYSMHKNRMLKPVYCRSTGYLMIDLSERGEVEKQDSRQSRPLLIRSDFVR